VRSKYLAAIGAMLCLPGLSLLFLGARRTRLLAAPLALCWFALPIPAALEDPLGINAVTAEITGRILRALGVLVLRHHTVFVTRQAPINVSQNCSGLAAMYAAAALAFVLVNGARDRLRRIVIPLLVFPLVVLSNGVRVAVMLLMIDRVGMGFLQTFWHGLFGLFVLWFALAGLWLAADHKGLRESLA
jgi:exosortase